MAHRPNWPFLGLLSLAVWVPLLVWVLHIDPRAAGAALGFAAFLACAWQFVAYYPWSPTVARAGLAIILVSLLVSSVAQAQFLAMGDIPLTWSTYPAIGQRVLCLLLALRWPNLLQYGTDSPWVRRRRARRSRPK